MIARIFSRGFTLIEVLVVIAIIGILSAVIYANFTDARNDAKNKAVQTALKQTQLALELYKAQNGKYPDAWDNSETGCSSSGGMGTYDYSGDPACGLSNRDAYIDGLVPEFLPELPHKTDSGNSNCSMVYSVATDNSWYTLTAVRCLAGAADETEGVQPGDEFAPCSSSCGSCSYAPNDVEFYESYAVYSAGGGCI